MTEEWRQRLQLAAELEPQGGDGRVYEVTLIRAGETLHGWLFPSQVLRESASLWEGATSLADHRTHQHPSVRDVVGSVGKVRYADGALVGEYRVLSSAEWLSRMLDQIIADREAGLPVPKVGLSADLLVKARRQDEKYIAERIGKVLSVDVVFDPAAGGAFERVLNSVMEKGGCEMTKEQNEALEGEALGRMEEMERAQCAHLLRASLNASDLPPAMKEEVRGRFEGRIFTVEELNQAIGSQERLLAKLVEDEVIKGLGEPTVTAMWDSLDRIQMAADRLMGVPIPEHHSDIPRLSGIRELYLLLTGDWDFYGLSSMGSPRG